jgi:hypothetical protein
MEGRFQPGDHLQVRRPMGYYHHGIYVTDERVIQFGSGVMLLNKGDAAIDAVTLRDFEQRSTAEVVRHGYESWFTGHHPAADEPWKIIARAEFLLKLQPKLPYNLIGHNCEIIANMCVSGSWTESYQVRRVFGARAYMDFVFLIWLSGQTRRKLAVPRWIPPVAVAVVVVSVAAIGAYNYQIKKFWEEIRGDWLAHERMLAEDPRNGAGG